MVYLSIFVLLLVCSLVHEKKDVSYFFVMCVLYFVFLALRYGQGTDYFNYKTLYLLNPEQYENFFVNSYKNATEPLFFLLNVFARQCGLGFQFVIIFCALICVGCSFFFIKKFSVYKLFSFFILYTNYFFYFQSAIRQSVAMVIIATAIFNYVKQKKKCFYYLLVCLAMMFHTSAIIGVVIPFILRINLKFIFNPFNFLCIAILSIVLSVFIPKILVLIISLINPRYSYYSSNFSTNYGAILLRFILSFLVIYLTRKNKIDEFSRKIAVLYLVGNLIYFSVSSISILSRLSDYFSFLEVILIPNIVTKPKMNDLKCSFCVFILLFSALFIKDIGEAQKQDNYYSKDIFDYPYITVFNKERVLAEKDITQVLNSRLLEEK